MTGQRAYELGAALEAATGRRPIWGWIEKLTAYLEESGLTVDDIELRDTGDRNWSERHTRTDLEKTAALIGRTRSGGKNQVWWAVPKAPEAN